MPQTRIRPALPRTGEANHWAAVAQGRKSDIYWVGPVPVGGQRGVPSNLDHQGIGSLHAAEPWGEANGGVPVAGSSFQPGVCLVRRIQMEGWDPVALADELHDGVIQELSALLLQQ